MIDVNMQPFLAFIEISVGTIVWIVAGIFATMKAIRYTSGAATPLWLALIWLVPCLGAILAFIGIRRTDISTELERLEDDIRQ
tara:strand:+ start:4407 stop:4655 length:249 start_codon:yes stop_codon:yes gene_type:complete